MRMFTIAIQLAFLENKKDKAVEVRISEESLNWLRKLFIEARERSLGQMHFNPTLAVELSHCIRMICDALDTRNQKEFEKTLTN